MNETQPLVSVQNLVKAFPGHARHHHPAPGGRRASGGRHFLRYPARETRWGWLGRAAAEKPPPVAPSWVLYSPTSGKVRIETHEVQAIKGDQPLALRRKAQIIFQDPFASLNPRWTVNSIISEPIRVHKLLQSEKERSERVKELLELVGLNARHVNRFPHEFSGGQRQRIGIARALASEPMFIVCDEPISALDVSIQAQVVNLLEDLQERLGLTYLFIAHDLSMVRHICDRVAVMYLGVLVELAERDALYEHPLHPYSQALLSAVPIPDPKKDRARHRVVLTGDVPSPLHPPPGCRFHPRCPIAMPQCSELTCPEWRQVEPDHWVACHAV
jgi:oligopeptide transport system ATP-binding protein